MTNVRVDHRRFMDALVILRLHTEDGNARFRDQVDKYACDAEVGANDLLRGLSPSSVKGMRRGSTKVPTTVPRALALIVFQLTARDVTQTQCLAFFCRLGFDIQLEIIVETKNESKEGATEYELKGFLFEVHEANAIAEAPDEPDIELNLRIGFDRVRLTVRSDSLEVIGNQVCAETPRDAGRDLGSDYTGWFKMRFVNRDPLSWIFEPHIEGEVLKNRVDAKRLAHISAKEGAAVVAELTARRDALKVRIVEEGGRKASKKLSEDHRDKMCAALARRSMISSADEYVLNRKSLVRAWI